nr:MAG TPA: hypothetical protein [Caudoviricetes sp.]
MSQFHGNRPYKLGLIRSSGRADTLLLSLMGKPYG